MLSPRIYSLIAIADEGSLSKAALKLHITQPAVSQHLRILEDEFENCKLFVRTDYGMKITPEGELVVQYAKRIVALYEAMQIQLDDFKKNKRHLNAGISDTVELTIMTEMFARFCETHPNSSVRIVSGTNAELCNQLSLFKIDFVIGDAKAVAGLKNIRLNTEHFLCIVSKESPLAVRRFMNLSDLRRQKLILLPRGEVARDVFENYLNSINDSIDNYNVTLELNDQEVIRELVSQNVGISILPQGLCHKDIMRGKLASIPIENLNLSREVNIIYHPESPNTDIFEDLSATYSTMFK